MWHVHPRHARRWALAALIVVSCTPAKPPEQKPRSTNYADLVALFGEWRSFQRPKLLDGVPDYSAKAMAAQHRDLAPLEVSANRQSPAAASTFAPPVFRPALARGGGDAGAARGRKPPLLSLRLVRLQMAGDRLRELFDESRKSIAFVLHWSGHYLRISSGQIIRPSSCGPPASRPAFQCHRAAGRG